MAGDDWQSAAVNELLASQNADGGWSYRAGGACATEPTALAVLALSRREVAAPVLNTAADWLTARRRGDGLFTASVVHEEASWLTPLAALALNQQDMTTASQAAAEALLSLPVSTAGDAPPGVYGYDTEIRGWPWTAGDFSFVEPTSLAMIFLKQMGRRDAPRVRDGARLLRDRALAAGGWNYGEPEVLGGTLYPAVVPTSLALLALADEQDDATAPALSWLAGQRGGITSLMSLGWAAIALNLLGRLDASWEADVIACWQETPLDRRGPMETSLCLLGLMDSADHPLTVTA